VGGGSQAFVLRSGGGIKRSDITTIPDVVYLYARIGLGARFVLPNGVTIGLAGAYRAVLNRGGDKTLQIAHDGTPAMPNGYFPYLTVKGMDLGATLGYQVTPSIEVRLGVDLKRYGYAMNSSGEAYPLGDFVNPADPNSRVNKVAGGAVDQFISGTLGVSYVFGGVAPGAEPAAEEAPPPEKKKKKKKKKKAEDEDEDGGDGGGDEGSSEGEED
jgi:hypothetical protein